MGKKSIGYVKIESDGMCKDAYPIPKDHPIVVMLVEHINNIEKQNSLLCKIVGPKIAKKIRQTKP
jgi:hypothetical protein